MAGGVILSRGQTQRGAIAQGQDALHGALAKRLLAHDHRALEILQAAGNDLGRAGAAAVDQHHHWQFANLAAAPGAILFLALRSPAFGAHHHLAAREKLFRHVNRLIQQAAGIVAQIENQAGAVLLLNFGQRFLQILRGVIAKLADANVADGFRQEFIVRGAFEIDHGTDGDHFADEFDLLGLAGAGPEKSQLHLGGRLAAELLHRFREIASHVFAIHLEQFIPGQDAGLFPGGAFHWGDHRDAVRPDGDHEANATVLAFGILAEFVVLARLHVLAVRVQRVEHAFQRAFDQGIIGKVLALDVLLPDALHDQRENAQRFIRLVRLGGRSGTEINPRADEGIDHQQRGDQCVEEFAFHRYDLFRWREGRSHSGRTQGSARTGATNFATRKTVGQQAYRNRAGVT